MPLKLGARNLPSAIWLLTDWGKSIGCVGILEIDWVRLHFDIFFVVVDKSKKSAKIKNQKNKFIFS